MSFYSQPGAPFVKNKKSGWNDVLAEKDETNFS